jgi:hypothetical protein
MVRAMTTRPPVQWTAPAPLWPALINSTAVTERVQFHRPAILRFVTDDFMNELLQVVAHEPARLGEWQAVAETWRQPAMIPAPVKFLPSFAQRFHFIHMGLDSLAEGSATPPQRQNQSTMPIELTTEENEPAEEENKPPEDLTLYQPAHQRFYLVTACLVCRVPGLPDRLSDVNSDERVSFVMRRLRPNPENPEQFDEYAFVSTPGGNHWELLGGVTDPHVRILFPGEEQLPLFGVTYLEDDGRRRRLLGGLIPVGRRETYIGAPMVRRSIAATESIPGEGVQPVLDETTDPRLALLHTLVVAPWQALSRAEGRLETDEALEQRLTEEGINEDDDPGAWSEAYEMHDRVRGQTNQQIRTASWYILLDLADYLDTCDIKDSVLRELRESSDSSAGELAEALEEITGHRGQLEGAVLANKRPEVGPTLADPPGEDSPSVAFEYDDSENEIVKSDSWPEVLLPMNPDDVDNLIDALKELVATALEDKEIQEGTPPLPLAAQQTAIEMNEPAWFIIRCVFERPHCVSQPAWVVSEPTERFQMASFFDPKAPARPVRISMPVDTSPAGLRKFAKNTAFMMSDILACQLGQIQNITLADLVLSVLPWPFHKDLPDPTNVPCASSGVGEGMVCSLSIPIVTLCALILLIVMVNLFEPFFRWVPFLISCFKINLSGKSEAV